MLGSHAQGIVPGTGAALRVAELAHPRVWYEKAASVRPAGAHRSVIQPRRRVCGVGSGFLGSVTS